MKTTIDTSEQDVADAMKFTRSYSSGASATTPSPPAPVRTLSCSTKATGRTRSQQAPRDNVVSLGGGAVYADLLFQKVGNDLVLKVGATDQITFTGYYTATTNRSVDKLQVVIEGTSDYLPGGGNVTRDNKIETFNFEGLVAAFDAARVANPTLTTWALTNALATQYLTGSDTAAIGGNLAYRYNRFGTLGDISFNPALAMASVLPWNNLGPLISAIATH